jgi:SRSO17 transposase
MDLNDLRRLRPALDRFARQFDDCYRTRPSRRHLRTYLNGQLGPLERKSVEPIALDARVHQRTLQEFLSILRWDEQAVARRLRELVKRDHADPNAIAVIDETSFKKKGDKTAGVQRQHCGAAGKTENCVVTVHLGYVANDFHTLLDGDLYLPEESWSNDRARCRSAGIPDDVVYRAKWRIALDLLERSRREGVPMAWLTADEAYGRVGEFRETVAALGLSYVVEIPSSLSGWTRKPEIEPAGTVTACGRTLTKARVAVGEKEARQVSRLWQRGGPSWKQYQIKTTQKGPVVWEVRETRFFPNHDGVPGEEQRLLVLREVLSGEVKYFLSNAKSDVPLKTLLYVAFSRWHIERLFEDGKGEVGFDHFEVRCYRSLMRHLVLSMLSLYFLCEQTERLRGEKPVVDAFAGEDGGRGATGSGEVAA